MKNFVAAVIVALVFSSMSSAHEPLNPPATETGTYWVWPTDSTVEKDSLLLLNMSIMEMVCKKAPNETDCHSMAKYPAAGSRAIITGASGAVYRLDLDSQKVVAFVNAKLPLSDILSTKEMSAYQVGQAAEAFFSITFLDAAGKIVATYPFLVILNPETHKADVEFLTK